MKVLLRLLPYIKAHIWAFSFGMFGLLIARLFEAMIPMFIKTGIDSITNSEPKILSGDLNLDTAQSLLRCPILFWFIAIWHSFLFAKAGNSKRLIIISSCAVWATSRKQNCDHC